MSCPPKAPSFPNKIYLFQKVLIVGMIKSRAYLGLGLITMGIIFFVIFFFNGMINTFMAGAVTMTLIFLGFFYVFFAAETPEYLKEIQSKKKRKFLNK